MNFDRLQRCEIQVHDDAPADNSGDFPEVYRVSNATLGVSGVAEILRKRLKVKGSGSSCFMRLINGRLEIRPKHDGCRYERRGLSTASS